MYHCRGFPVGLRSNYRLGVLSPGLDLAGAAFGLAGTDFGLLGGTAGLLTCGLVGGALRSAVAGRCTLVAGLGAGDADGRSTFDGTAGFAAAAPAGRAPA